MAYRSAKSGRYVRKAAAVRCPGTTIPASTSGSEASGSRSAISGRFVKEQTARRHLYITVTEGVRG